MNLNKFYYTSLDQIPPFTITLMLSTGVSVETEVTYIYIKDGTFDRNDPPADYNGYFDVEYLYKTKLSLFEQKELDKRVHKYVKDLYSSSDVL